VTGRLITAASIVLLAGCTAGPANTAGRESPTPAAGKASTSTAVTPGSSARLIQPPGPISARPALLNQATAMCRRAGAPDVALCAGTIDAEVWGLPLVIVSHVRDLLACMIKVNVLDSATTLDGPDSNVVAYSNDDTLYSTAFLDLRAGRKNVVSSRIDDLNFTCLLGWRFQCQPGKTDHQTCEKRQGFRHHVVKSWSIEIVS